jgi:hypothetical protein
VKWSYLIVPILTAGGAILEKPGPYELEGSVLGVLQFVFTMMILIGKYRPVRMTSAFLSALFGGAALVVYYINQTSVGNPLSLWPLAFFGGGIFYGSIIGAIVLRNIIRDRRFSKEIKKKASQLDPRERRFED